MTTIRYTMSVAIRLIDTTTGDDALGKTVIKFDSKIAEPLKNGVFYVILEPLSGQVALEVIKEGYEAFYGLIDADALDKVTPIYVASLIPKVKGESPFELIEYCGHKEGIIGVDCVRVIESSLSFAAYDEKKRLMTIINPFKLDLSAPAYALMNADNTAYEVFRIIKKVSDTQIKIDVSLSRVPDVNTAISNLIYGIVKDDGGYILRARDSSEKTLFIVRELYSDTTEFITTEFSQQTRGLERHPPTLNGLAERSDAAIYSQQTRGLGGCPPILNMKGG